MCGTQTTELEVHVDTISRPLARRESPDGHVLEKSRGRRQFATIGVRLGADLGYHGVVKKGGGVWSAGVSNLSVTRIFLCRESKLRGLM